MAQEGRDAIQYRAKVAAHFLEVHEEDVRFLRRHGERGEREGHDEREVDLTPHIKVEVARLTLE